jgi:hypothetical protein
MTLRTPGATNERYCTFSNLIIVGYGFCDSIALDVLHS